MAIIKKKGGKITLNQNLNVKLSLFLQDMENKEAGYPPQSQPLQMLEFQMKYGMVK